MRTPLDRSYAQKLRTDRKVAYETPAARAAFWARQQVLVALEQDREMNQSVVEISQGNPRSQTAFETANIQGATLDSPPPPIPGMAATVAGLTEAGVAPPPPPRG